ncbi:MAG TPA: AAA family ATPase [Symbiobacteriaceae bacterium]|jgi:septum formation inhibitor-activating ATPase MinD
MLAHRNPTVLNALAFELRALGVPPEILSGEPHSLRAALLAMSGGVAVLDIDLVPAATAVLRQVKGRLVVVTALPQDPRAAKLTQLGLEVVPAAQVAQHLAQALGLQAALPRAQDEAARPEGRAPIIVLHSPKGGAGTSTVAAHLASYWANQGQQVALVDLAPYGAQAVIFKVQQRSMGMEALIAALETTPAGMTDGSLDLARYRASMAVKFGRLDLLGGARPRIMDRLKADQVGQLLERLAESSYDRVIVDTSTEPAPRNLAALAAADQILLVGDPDFVCGWNMVHLQELLGILQPTGQTLLVFNRVGSALGLTADALAGRLQLPLAGILPEDPQVTQLGNQGAPWELPPRSAFAGAIVQLAAALVGEGEPALNG